MAFGAPSFKLYSGRQYELGAWLLSGEETWLRPARGKDCEGHGVMVGRDRRSCMVEAGIPLEQAKHPENSSFLTRVRGSGG